MTDKLHFSAAVLITVVYVNAEPPEATTLLLVQLGADHVFFFSFVYLFVCFSYLIFPFMRELNDKTKSHRN